MQTTLSLMHNSRPCWTNCLCCATARDLIKESNAQMEKDKATASLKRTRFEARKNVTTLSRSRDDVEIETLIFNTAANFPFRTITYPRISTFLPCFATPMCYLKHMDYLKFILVFCSTSRPFVLWNALVCCPPVLKS